MRPSLLMLLPHARSIHAELLPAKGEGAVVGGAGKSGGKGKAAASQEV